MPVPALHRPLAALAAAALVAPLVIGWSATASAVEDVSVQRLAGTDRYDTAARIALEAFDSAETVLLASGEAGHDADALAGNYLAGRLGAPVLLTAGASLPVATRSALQRLQAENVVVLGGPSAVSDAVLDVLEQEHAVRRVAGPDRYSTARAIATDASAEGVGTVPGEGRTAILARGDGYADALVAGPLAWAAHLPVLTTDPARLDGNARASLQDLGIEHVLIAGGPSAVSAAVADEVSGLNGGTATTRLAGSSRTATAVEIAEYALAQLDFDDSRVTVTRADDFADALAGGALGGVERSVTVTAAGPAELGDAARSFLRAHAETLQDVRLLGGEAALSAPVAQDVTRAAATTTVPLPAEPSPSASPSAPAASPSPTAPTTGETGPAALPPTGGGDPGSGGSGGGGGGAGGGGTGGEPPVEDGEQPPAATTGAALRLDDATVVRGEEVYFRTEDSSAPHGLTFVRWSMSYDGEARPSRTGNGAPPPYVRHAFTVAGDHTATLSVTDSQGTTTTATVALTVVEPPTARISTRPAPAEGPVDDGGFSVVFDGSASTPTTGQLVSWSMHYGDGQEAAARYTSGTGAPPATLQHTYTLPGTYVVQLTVTDASGATGTARTTVTAYADSPQAQLFGGRGQWVDGERRSYGTVDRTVHLDASQSVAGHRSSWRSWSLSFDDGSAPLTGAGPPPSSARHVFTTTGEHVVTLVVTDSSGRSDSAELTVEVVEAPVARLGTDPSPAGGTFGDDGLTVTFDGSASTAGSGRRITYWYLDFGDCCTDDERYSTSGVGAPPAEILHAYRRSGTFTAELVIYDDTGEQHVTTVEVEARDGRARAGLQAGRYEGDGGPFATVGEPTAFTTAGTAPGADEDLVSWSVDAGDGSAPRTGNGAVPYELQHTYDRSGTFRVTLSVRDSGGVESSAAVDLTVVGAPTARLSSSAPTDGVALVDGRAEVVFDLTQVAAAPGRRIESSTLYVDDDHRYWDGAPTGPVHRVFTRAGEHTAYLTVRDDTGAYARAQLTVLVYESAPTAVLSGGRYTETGGPYAAPAEEVWFWGGQSRAGHGQHLATWAYDYGDGTSLQGNGSPPWGWDARHAFALPGRYTVTLTVTDTGGGTDTASLELTVLDPPTPSLTATVVSADADGFTVRFDGSTSSAPSGYRLTDWSLSYGDGRTDRGTGTPGAAMLHRFTGHGDRTASLTVTDSAGSAATVQLLVDGPDRAA